MRVLIGCECSGVVRRAFRDAGHDAWSCDLKPAGDASEFHYQCDLLDLLLRHGAWDVAIFHPDCTLFNNASAWAIPDPDFDRFPGVGYHQKVKPGTLTGVDRRAARGEAVEFFLSLWRSRIKRVAIENPTGHMNTHQAMAGVRPQIIQPYEFGDDASKATCLWLRGLPWLTIDPLKRKTGRIVKWRGKTVERWGNQTDGGQNKLPPSDDRAAARAQTYPGIAKAMAEQWPLRDLNETT